MRSITITILLLVLTLCGCGSDDGAVSLYTTAGDIHTPVAGKLVHGTVLVVNAVVNGSIHLAMLVDTGSSASFVPAAIFGNLDGQVYITSLCLEGNVCFNNFMAWSSDSAFTQSMEGYFNGVIGVDLLKNFDITFDYKSELIYFYDTLENDSPGLVTLPFYYETGRPHTTVTIEGIPMAATLLDTGAAYTRITSLTFDSLNQSPSVLFKSVVFNFNGSEIVEYMPLTEYCIELACPGEIIVQLGSWPAVGGTFFREYLTVFMFSENALKLERYDNRSHIKESGIQRLGLQINIYDASEIIYVMEGSFAWNAGLREGYEIISINGAPVETFGYLGIYELLSDSLIMEYQFLIVTTQNDVEEVVVTLY